MYRELEGIELKSPSKDFQVLLGMDIISIGSLKIEGNGTFSFSYCFHTALSQSNQRTLTRTLAMRKHYDFSNSRPNP